MNVLQFKTALLVEDEPHLANTLKIALSKLGIQAVTASTLSEARKIMQSFTPEFILLDRLLPDGDGLDLCAELRSSDIPVTILVLTASGDTEARIQGLNQGADDYLPKPFSWEELEARIRALARRRTPPTAQSHPAHPNEIWRLNPSQLQISGPMGWVTLTPLEYKLATRLIHTPHRIISRNELLKDVWGFTLLPKTRTVDHFLGRLRKYFEKDPEKPVHFLTIRGAGYQFIP